MKKCALLIVVLALALLPAIASADVSVTQDSCRQSVTPGGKVNVTVYFSVVNFNSANPICDLHLIPEGTPPDPGCIVIGCSPPNALWTCGLRADGGVDYVATTAGGCITAGHILRGYSFTLDPEFCCYTAQFTGASGEVLFTQEECFSCVKVGTEQKPWSGIKQLYR